MQTQQTQNAVRRRLADLKTLRDMVRVDINLAGKEARERWRRIEARISTVEKRVRGSAGFHSLESLIQVVQDYRSSFRARANAVHFSGPSSVSGACGGSYSS